MLSNNNCVIVDSTGSSRSDEGSDHPPLSQSKLCDSFMEVGSLLFSSCPELFSNALTQLSNQFSLALVKNPNVLRSTSHVASSAGQKRGRCDCDEATEEQISCSKPVKKCTPFRKYVLPKDAPPEYYQCMDCGERRSENSFQNDHTHFGKRPKVRWYCPLCKTFFAVTHRSGHIKCRHPSSETSSVACSPNNETIPDADVSKSCEHSVVSSPRRIEEERVVPPARKYVCMPSSVQTDVCSATNSRVSSSDDLSKEEPAAAANDSVLLNSPPEENVTTSDAFVPVVRVPSTPSMFNSTSVVSDVYPEEDLLPAFRCPSYVLMPDSGLAEKPADSNSGFIFM